MRHAAFTLIELLTVIAIILVLAGLLLYIAGSANYKASTARAQSEIQAMSTALESYKADNGAYPRSSDTDALNAQPAAASAPADPSTYTATGTAASQYLYQCLSGYNGTTTYGKRYMEFKPGQLSTSTAAPTLTGTYVIDPFGLAYGYSTANAKEQDRVNSTTPPGTFNNAMGYNPTFDLWSTAGYANAGGKSYPSGATTGAAAVALWVKNW